MPASKPPKSGEKDRSADQRRSRRTHALKPTRITLKDRRLRLNDISNEGIGVVIDSAAPLFFPGQRLEAIGLPLQSGMVVVNGVVSHISETATGKVCGIRFLFDGDEFEAVRRFKKECTLPE